MSDIDQSKSEVNTIEYRYSISRLPIKPNRPIQTRTNQFDIETEEAIERFYQRCYQMQNCIDRIRIIIYNRF